ncbi:SPASM domain-containing protein [Actinoplanes sp. LDG1-06]|uniref:SPASM domain-containing protein n=1 Tax=Paractinoplanes ovalisporus TaxID=2810368 RepID=A0ABS2AML9_9ACTN|nr:SPASM domain-containing protein [Actinoplanes ovalisporus]MBM2621082.1 SPASM domain-containing protein [Actinoplanes ovalisporus]
MKESRYNTWLDDGPTTYVHNGFSGRTVSMPLSQREPTRRFIAGDDTVTIDPALIDTLVDARAIVADHADELDLLRQRYERTRRNRGRFHLTIVPSLGCDLDCPYCFEAKHPSLLDDDVETSLLRLVDQKLSAVRSLGVLWYGGEPLVGLKSLLSLSDNFIARCSAAGVAYAAEIVTNGHLLTAPTARLLRERRVEAAQVTIDGPPEVHDRRRPLAGGRGTFEQLLANVTAVAGILDVTVRVNLDTANVGEAPRLLEILAAAGLAGRIGVYAAQVVATTANPLAPSARYATACLSRTGFAEAEEQFTEAAARLGFVTAGLPEPTGAPCTAVRDNELVIGSRGEIYKCTETIGDPAEVIGNLRNWPQAGDRLSKWLTYDPFGDPECRTCVALPVCMGGCAYHAMTSAAPDTRCSTFRLRTEQQIRRVVTGRRGPSALRSPTAGPS